MSPEALVTPAGESVAGAALARAHPPSVLVVDDDPHVVRLVCEALEVADVCATPAHSQREAVECLRSHYFDAVVTDLNMPYGGGREVLTEARASSAGPEVVVLTGAAEIATAVECMQLGAYHYLCKPFDVGELVRIVRRAIERHRLVLESRELREVIRRTKHALMVALEARDAYTFGHCASVARLALQFGQYIGAPSSVLDAIANVGELHDIGKVGIRDAILNKPGPLSESEMEAMRIHPMVGRSILDPLGTRPDEGALVYHHHERWDGSGYPDGAAGADIPFVARLTAVVDVFDAMTTDRPYRRARPFEEALDTIAGGRGTLFDPHIASEFLAFIKHEFGPYGERQRRGPVAATQAVTSPREQPAKLEFTAPNQKAAR